MDSSVDMQSDVTYAELGLAEDHFSCPNGHFGLSQSEELEQAINNCKCLILKANPNSERYRNLICKLIQLRIKCEELKDDSIEVEKDVILVMDHRLRSKHSKSTGHFCEQCNSLIWGVIQNWRRCLDCGYKCHSKCISQITRNCAMTKVKERPEYILQLCPRHPKGLSAQFYRCAECKRKIAVADGSEARLCAYNGLYYCEMCHWNDLMHIPAQILLNWQYEKLKVCRASKQFLKLMMKEAVINVQEVNPTLFNYVGQLSDARALREELLLMKKYIVACPKAMLAKLLLQLSSRPHFVDCSDRYSLQDLLDLDDTLVPELVQIHSCWAQHIKTDCELCQARGYFCELCASKEVLFGFENIAMKCVSCFTVMHRICFARHVKCPKCDRQRHRDLDQNSVDEV